MLGRPLTRAPAGNRAPRPWGLARPGAPQARRRLDNAEYSAKQRGGRTAWAALAAALALLAACGGSGKAPAPPRGGAVLPPVPGARNPAVTQSTVATTVCVRGYTATIRPPVSYTSALKRRLLDSLPGTVRDYQLDHLLSLEVGGAPRSTQNLWMQPLAPAHRDDRLENNWHRQLCAGTLTLAQAQGAELAWKEKNG